MKLEKSLAPRLVLVRHAEPVVDPQRLAHEWQLADGAEKEALSLAAQLRSLGVDGIMTSPERKAAATAEVIAIVLGLELGEETLLREQGGESVPWFESGSAFRTAVADHFSRPDEVVLGNESSNEAVERFATAVERARSRYRFPLLVAHGRIMSGFAGRVIDTHPMDFWKDLRMPDAFVIDFLTRTCKRLGAKET